MASWTVLVFFLCHWLGCAWRILVRFEEDPRTTWLHANGMADETVGNMYLYTTYWAVMTISTVGYGYAANPATTVEYLVAIAAMFLGATVWVRRCAALGHFRPPPHRPPPQPPSSHAPTRALSWRGCLLCPRPARAHPHPLPLRWPP